MTKPPIGFIALLFDAFFFPRHAAKALHGGDVAEALFDGVGCGGPRSAAVLIDPSGNP